MREINKNLINRYTIRQNKVNNMKQEENNNLCSYIDIIYEDNNSQVINLTDYRKRKELDDHKSKNI